jgi:site-specific DNA-methyltransferase (adenine-specific)
MYRITRLNRDGDTVADLVQAALSSRLQSGDKQNLAIHGINAVVRQIVKNPDTIRVMTQGEFEYQGVVDGNDKTIPATLDPLSVDWYDSTFAIADYSKVRVWVKKACEEANKGRTVVMLVPARTNTRWFHNYVLPYASDIRFIKGCITLKCETRRNVAPDCLVVYNKVVSMIPSSNPSSVAIIAMRTSFTDGNNDVFEESEDDEDEDET